MIRRGPQVSLEDMVGLYHSALRRNGVVQFRLISINLARDRGRHLTSRAQEIMQSELWMI